MSKMKVKIEFECELEGIAQSYSKIRVTKDKCKLEKDIGEYIEKVFTEVFITREDELFRGIYTKDNKLNVNVILQGIPKRYISVWDYIEDKINEYR